MRTVLVLCASSAVYSFRVVSCRVVVVKTDVSVRKQFNHFDLMHTDVLRNMITHRPTRCQVYYPYSAWSLLSSGMIQQWRGNMALWHKLLPRLGYYPASERSIDSVIQ
jgi:hypothetical protein